MTKNSFDIAIIGSGLGGLIAGAKLSKEGKKVCMIEQHSIVGGCATTFKRKDYTMEVGLHELDGLDKNDFKKEIFDDLKISENIEFLKIPEFYRFKNENVDIVVPDGINEATKVLISRFPIEAKGIKKYFKVINNIHKEIKKLPLQKWKQILLLPFFPIFFPYLSNSSSRFAKFASLTNPLFLLLHPNLIFWNYRDIGSFLDSIIKDEELKLVLLANIQYYHDDPYTMSLIYYSAAQASYYNGGGHFIKGGSQKLSDYLAKIIVDNGGQILKQQIATQILMHNNKAVGVKYQKTNDKDISNEVYANITIANCAIPNVMNMLPNKNQIKLKQHIKNLKNSCSLISIYIGFKRDIKELGSKHYSTFFFDKSVKTQKDMLSNHKGDIKNRNYVFVDYSQINSGLTTKDKTFGVVCTVDYIEDWDNLSKEQYNNKKEAIAQIFIDKLEKKFAGIKKEIECYEVGTSKTIMRYTLNPGGSPYGYAQIPEQSGLFRAPNKSVVKNLYFASAWTNPGGGFTGAILSGWFCANQILK